MAEAQQPSSVELATQLRRELKGLRFYGKVSHDIGPAIPDLLGEDAAMVETKMRELQAVLEREKKVIEQVYARIDSLKKELRQREEAVLSIKNKEGKFSRHKQALESKNTKFRDNSEWMDIKKALENLPKILSRATDTLKAFDTSLIKEAEQELARLIAALNREVETTRVSIAGVLAKNAPKKKNGSSLPPVAVPGKSTDNHQKKNFVTKKDRREAKKEKNRKGRWSNPPITNDEINLKKIEVSLQNFPMPPTEGSFIVSQNGITEIQSVPPVTRAELSDWKTIFVDPFVK